MGERTTILTAPVLDSPVPRPVDTSVDPIEATAFLRLYYAEQRSAVEYTSRLASVLAEIERTGTYTHTRDELVFGARVAWREAHPQLGRQYWFGVEVRDLRHVSTTGNAIPELINHLRLTAARGRHPVRPIISVFAAETAAGKARLRVWNERLVAFAGYRPPSPFAAFSARAQTARSAAASVDPVTGVIGDPNTLEFTTTLQAYGWSGPGTSSDVLPLVIESPTEGACLFDLPGDLTERVSTLPTATIAHLRLVIGGVSYPLAPFNAVLDDGLGGRMPGRGDLPRPASERPRFVLDHWAEILSRYGQAPVVPAAVSRPSIPGIASRLPGAPLRIKPIFA